MKWILILMMYNAGVDHVEFIDRAACESARAAVLRDPPINTRGFCVPEETMPADPRGGEPEEDGG